MLSSLVGLASLTTIASSAGDAASAVVDAAASATGAAADAVGQPLTKYVVIAVGLLLIAAGIFSFDKTRELIVQAGKTAGKAAGTAAAAGAAAA